jgi:tRNA A-37 threonylcarbamoyl transferase component Bud32
MRDITELIQNVDKYKDVVIQIRLKSKKNTVAYVTMNEKPRVLKWFVPGLKKQMKTEYELLKEGSSKLNIPTVHEMDEENNVLTTGYITGENLCDFINNEKAPTSEKQKLIVLLAKWFADFHDHFKTESQFRIRGDPTLKNFIFNDKIWGVDFEESRMGVPSEDIAGACASILSTDPMFTKEKFELCKLFLESYTKLAPERIKNIGNEIAYALLEKIQWRPRDEEILRKYSKIIKKQGLDKVISVTY